jgi:multiple sugar transport system ATP-binding protein
MGSIVLGSVTKVYENPKGEKIQALNNLDLTVKDGEFLVIVGPSGSGKTTILRLIAGLEQVTSGTISIEGRVVNEIAPKDRDVAMVFQHFALYPHMSAYQNMAFGLELRKVPKMEIEKRVKEAAQILDLEDCLGRRPEALSGGQRQRVALGRAIVRQPKVCLLDEPLSNLDSVMRAEIRAELAKLHKRLAMTMLYVTHDQQEALALGDRIAVIRDGILQQVGTALEVYHRPEKMFVGAFIGSPPMNFVRGTIVSKGEMLVFETSIEPDERLIGRMIFPLGRESSRRMRGFAGRKIVLGIRPENIRESNDVGDTAPGLKIDAEVEIVEPLGSHMDLHLLSSRHSFVARIPQNSRVNVNQRISIVFEMDHAQFFDAGTQERIG